MGLRGHARVTSIHPFLRELLLSLTTEFILERIEKDEEACDKCKDCAYTFRQLATTPLRRWNKTLN